MQSLNDMERFKLDENKKIKTGFTTPEDYFDSLTERLMLQLPEKEAKVIPLYRKATVWISTAAAVLVLALGLMMYFKSGVQAVQPDNASIENYLAYQSNISSYDIIQQLDQQDIDELESALSINEVNYNAAEEYLYEQNITIYE